MSTTVWSLLAVCLVAFVRHATPDVIRQMKNARESTNSRALESTTPAADCAEVLKRGHSTSGVYNITVLGKTLTVFCDQSSENGGWLVIQRRVDNTTDFNRDWKSYKEGFGDPAHSFWLGNVYLHAITAHKKYSLRVDFTTATGKTMFANYKDFAVGNEGNKYKLTLGSYHGTAGDSLSYHNGMAFSTRDRDNDVWKYGSCADVQKAGWWYGGCSVGNLNMEDPFYGMFFDLNSAVMKIRPL